MTSHFKTFNKGKQIENCLHLIPNKIIVDNTSPSILSGKKETLTNMIKTSEH